jgi:hypothetical protein
MEDILEVNAVNQWNYHKEAVWWDFEPIRISYTRYRGVQDNDAKVYMLREEFRFIILGLGLWILRIKYINK